MRAGEIASWFFFVRSQIDWMVALGLFGILLLCYILIRAQHDRKNPVDLAYLLVDPETRRVSLAKFTGVGSFISSTWVFIYLPVSNHFDATYASAYLLAWGAVKVAGDVWKSRPPDAPAGG